jgi:hypothetical protein
LFEEDLSIGCQASIQLKFFPCEHSARCTGRQSIVAFTGNEGSHENQELEPRLLAGFLPSHCALEVSRGTILRSCAVYKEIDIEKCTIAELQTLIASKSHVAVGGTRILPAPWQCHNHEAKAQKLTLP